MKTLILCDYPDFQPRTTVPASVSASGFTARVDFTAFRAARFRMGQPAGQKLSDGRRGHGPHTGICDARQRREVFGSV